jgi:hypothetical protein
MEFLMFMGKRRYAVIKSQHVSVDKRNRDIFCKFKTAVRCIGLLNGKRICVVDESSKAKFNASHELQFGFCPLFPESEKVEFMASMKKLGISVRRL